MVLQYNFKKLTMMSNNTSESTNSVMCEYSVGLKSTLCTLLLSTSILSIAENVLFCYAVYRNTNLHKKSMVLIVSLSITDIIISTLLPTNEFGHIVLYPDWPYGLTSSFLTRGAWLFSIVLPFTTVLVIAIERYLATMQNSYFREYYSQRTLCIVTTSLWLYSIGWVCIMVLNLTYTSQHLIPPVLYYIFLVIHIGLPLCVITTLYVKIYRHVTESSRELSKHGHTTNHSRKELRLTKTIGVVILTLYFLWIPVMVIEVVRSNNYNVCVIKKIDSFNVLLTCFSGCLNPMIYSFRSAEVRKSLKEIKVNFMEKLVTNCSSKTVRDVEEPLLNA